MRLESKKYLHDVLRAVELIAQFTAGKSLNAYSSDPMLRAAVEREVKAMLGES